MGSGKKVKSGLTVGIRTTKTARVSKIAIFLYKLMCRNYTNNIINKNLKYIFLINVVFRLSPNVFIIGNANVRQPVAMATVVVSY